MALSEWVVLFAGLAAIAWVNWYFFRARRAPAVAATVAGTQEVVVTVKGGYDPAVIQVRHGQLVRLVFDRQEESGCSEEVVFPDFRIQRFLPAFARTAIEFTPEQPGTYEFTCGMRMLRGKVVVQ
jgi:plastocyanin domain-containing protein